ncbi:MAG: hypothetical protein JXQ85_05645 [Cognatishimia sp.]|uniref:hypothetical protein n=1 Tax=Cognatishimia sp. TaxID=2211648 RepID=UPI003B8D62AF
MNQIINMIIRRVIRQVVNRGVNAGIDAVAGKAKKGEGQAPQPNAKHAKQAMRMARRASKF